MERKKSKKNPIPSVHTVPAMILVRSIYLRQMIEFAFASFVPMVM
jgi:hypothetical protein